MDGASGREDEVHSGLLQTVAEVASVLLLGQPFEQAVLRALELLARSVEADRIGVLEHHDDPEGGLGWVTIEHEWHAHAVVSQRAHPRLARISYAGIEEVYTLGLAGRPWGGALETLSEPFRSSQAELGVRSTYAIPIFVAEDFWGYIGIDYCREARALSDAAVSALKAAAACIGSAIQRERIGRARADAERMALIAREKAAQERASELARINDTLRHSIAQLACGGDLQCFLGHVLQQLAGQLEVTAAQIFIYDPAERMLETSVGLVDGEMILSAPPYPRRFSVDTWPGWLELTRLGRARVVDMEREPHLFLPEYLEFHRRLGHRGIVCCLLALGSEPIGFIGFASRHKHSFSAADLEMVEALAQQATLAIQLARLAERVAREARQAAILDERNRIAREIHDTLAQGLAGIVVQLQAANDVHTRDPADREAHLAQASALARESLAEARRSVQALRPHLLEGRDLCLALRRTAERVALTSNAVVTCQIEGTPLRLSDEVEDNLLRIGQEALANAQRHAQATRIKLRLYYEPTVVRLEVDDDGRGFEPGAVTAGFGLAGMRERAARIGAQLQIESRPGCTAVQVALLVAPAGNGSKIP